MSMGILLMAGTAMAFLGSARPAFLSLHTIYFAFGCASIVFSATLVLYVLKYKNDVLEFAALDVLYGCVVLASLASFFLAAKRPQPIHQIYLVCAGFVLYILIRLSGERFAIARPGFFAPALLALASVEALHGLFQAASGTEMKGYFFNTNHFAMYLSLHVPLALALFWNPERRPIWRALLLTAAGLFLFCIFLSGCRTAYLALIITLPLMLYERFGAAFLGRQLKKWKLLWPLIGAAGVAAAGFIIKYLYLLRPISADGRLLVWKVSLRMLREFPGRGTGFGNFPAFYDLFQADFFSRGLGSVPERIAASHVFYAFNDYIETAVEFGLPGLALFATFWLLIMKNVRSGLHRPAGQATNDLRRGLAGSILIFMILSFFYYPSRILPIAIVFAICLAGLAGENTRGGRPAPKDRLRSVQENADAGQRFQSARRFRVPRPVLLTFAVIAFLATAALMPSLTRFFIAEKDWFAARLLEQQGRHHEALESLRRLLPRLKEDSDFLHHYALALMKEGDAGGAISWLEKARRIRPHPLLIEDLAQAYRAAGRPDEAAEAARLASDILPGRLTSKFMLAELALESGDATEAAIYARDVLDTPMRIRTEGGLKLKDRARAMLKSLPPALAATWHPESRQTMRQTPGLFPPLTDRLGLVPALKAAGRNAAELGNAFNAVDGDRRAAMGFLIANMPESDLRSLGAEFLLANLELAFQVRAALPYTRDIPEEIFLHYVLPYAQLNERRAAWRPGFYEKFFPIAARCSSVIEAVSALNARMYEMLKVGFCNRDFRKSILSPDQTVRKGCGSCAELAILLADACRAVGIPARLTFIPRWVGWKVGHMWIEVYAGGQWYYFGAFDKQTPWIGDRARQTDVSQPTNHIYAASFQRAALHAVFGGEVSLIDVTDDYVSEERKEGVRIHFLFWADLLAQRPPVWPAILPPLRISLQ